MNEPNTPVLVGDMIPVTYNGTNWVKADTVNNNWYDYNRGVWANAVTIKDSSKRAEYKNAQAGTTIDLSYVNLMLVWIPRYSYTLRQSYGYQIEGGSTPSQATPGAFDIKFVDTNTTEKGTGKYTGTTPSNYYTPSSFCWGNTCDTTRSGNTELSGIWISKFEITGDIENITSIPNQASLTNKNISSLFNAIKNQINGSSGTTNYGLSGTSYDTHMIKNTEWGAMAYLSQSKYGKYGNSKYTNANKEIYQNKSNEYKTGCSFGIPSNSDTNYGCQYTYDIEINGTGASTTGTIYGIYDTSGGAFERVMGNYNDEKGQSGFEEMPDAKYYNKYTSNTSIKGDAINVDGTNGFYGDFTIFVVSASPWFYRGARYNYGVVAGIFGFASTVGAADPSYGTRLVLSTW